MNTTSRDGIIMERQVHLNLTADDWELYTESKDCTNAANAINEAIETAFNSGADLPTVRKAAWKVMHAYRFYGAEDSEPLWKLDHLLNQLYGREK